MSHSLNRVQLIGNLTADPELKATRSELPVINFCIATNFTQKSEAGEKIKKAEFHSIVAYGKLAELINQYLHKGSKVFCEGKLRTSSWQDKDTGKKQYRTEVVIENVIFLNTPQNTLRSTSDMIADTFNGEVSDYL